MRLPWNRKYMEICFHIIVTVLILTVLIGLLFWLPHAKNVISETAGNFLAVFAPVFWALFFSLLLEPLVSFWQNFYEKHSSLYHRYRIDNRKSGTVLAYLSLGLFLFFLGSFFAERLGDTDIQSIAAQVSDYIRRIGDILVLLNLKLAEMGILSNVEDILSIWTEQLTLWAESKIFGIAKVISDIGCSLLDILVGLVAAFYFLMEKKRMLSICGSFSAVFLGKKDHWGDQECVLYGVFCFRRLSQRTDGGCGHHGSAVFGGVSDRRSAPCCFSGDPQWFFKPYSVFWCSYRLYSCGVFGTAQRYANEGCLCFCSDPASAAGGQHLHRAESGWETGGAASCSGAAFSGSIWQAVWLLGVVVCGSSGCPLQKFPFLAI